MNASAPMDDLPPGLADPQGDAQAVFRALLTALSRPAAAVPCPAVAPDVPGLAPAAAALLLALTDPETPVWWEGADASAWLRFHSGAPVAQRRDAAVFALVVEPAALGRAGGRLADFALGTDVSPERSTTLIVQLPALDGGPPMRASGPGLAAPVTLAPAGLPDGFWAQWADNHARFPSGVDLVLVAGDAIVGLPRTTRVSPADGG
ncbi:MAG: phosphonate C-P lyase system protein PhnH [Burkholderiales bacterium]|nr:phosphonate C-P lyase system protein PhnH [Burkholderiales bacterium]